MALVSKYCSINVLIDTSNSSYNYTVKLFTPAIIKYFRIGFKMF